MLCAPCVVVHHLWHCVVRYSSVNVDLPCALQPHTSSSRPFEQPNACIFCPPPFTSFLLQHQRGGQQNGSTNCSDRAGHHRRSAKSLHCLDPTLFHPFLLCLLPSLRAFYSLSFSCSHSILCLTQRNQTTLATTMSPVSCLCTAMSGPRPQSSLMVL